MIVNVIATIQHYQPSTHYYQPSLPSSPAFTAPDSTSTPQPPTLHSIHPPQTHNTTAVQTKTPKTSPTQSTLVSTIFMPY